ncbi:MAG: type II toxin-antitoxin system HicA family toxin [Dehalococcoidia bacterium]|nr:type II toxin-antitoxin system HicA family toxin [Dehalococcoidia bacterium]MXZ88951.1 type II toxin-antitoxin system HicA family toxin [Dehalococcoidia bacterium]
MPGKIPRDLRQSEVVAALVRLGGVERRGKGSHRVVNMPNGRAVSVPSTVKVGTLRSALRLAECSVDEFTRQLRR